ncbi:spore germination protein [Paenibacillus harenae]|uniref:spore germination protein n=1 Tax=Paenibacillus harenae TaxID=306543 RepID=UPI0027936C5D|nr:spore germination protein [Paenibacillus harenae]MDQ0057955.1 spore germination protein [Paenibacillus harenae]
MAYQAKDRITSIQTAVILANTMLGAGILTLPRTVAEKTGTPDGWISVIIGGFLAIAAGLIMVMLSKPFRGKTFYEYIGQITGKWLGSLISLIVVGYFCLIASFEIRVLAEVADFFLLEGTPSWAIIMVFMWVSLYLVTGGINAIARLFEIILPITIFVFVIVTFFGITLFDVDNLRPVLGQGVMPVLNGVKTTAITFTGFEAILIIIAFMHRPEKASKAVIVGTSIPLMIYIITVVMVIGSLSVDGVVTRTWPTLDLVRSVEIEGLIFERFESFLLVIWIMQIYSTFTMTYYAASLGLSQMSKRNLNGFLYGLLPVVFLMANIPKNLAGVFRMGDFIGNLSLYLFGAMPLLLLAISKLRGHKGEGISRK